jgi:hypothetical protein
MRTKAIKSKVESGPVALGGSRSSWLFCVGLSRALGWQGQVMQGDFCPGSLGCRTAGAAQHGLGTHQP